MLAVGSSASGRLLEYALRANWVGKTILCTCDYAYCIYGTLYRTLTVILLHTLNIDKVPRMFATSKGNSSPAIVRIV